MASKLDRYPLLQKIAAAGPTTAWTEALQHGDKMLALLSQGLQKEAELEADAKLAPEDVQQIEHKIENLTAIYTDLERILKHDV